jgi:hypothetical protein
MHFTNLIEPTRLKGGCMSHEENKEIGIGVSIFTLLRIVFPFWPNYGERLNQFCKKTGLGLQLIPVWWLTEKDISNIDPEYIISYESAWNNNETFWQWLKRLPKDPVALLGPLFFGFATQSNVRVQWFGEYFPDAFAVDIPGHRNYLMETSATNWTGPILGHIDNGAICFDTWHARDNSPSQAGYTIAAKRLHDLYANNKKSNIKLVHFQTRDKKDLHWFITSPEPMSTYLGGILYHSHRHSKSPIIIELKPCSEKTLLTVKKSIETFLSSMYFTSEK